MNQQQSPTFDEKSIQAFASQLQGRLIRPGDSQYDSARAVWNGMIDRCPALIARCLNNNDVIAALNFARDHHMLVAIRGGGHNVTGNAVCDHGLVIDLSEMKQIHVDPDARTVRAQGGVTWGELDHATQTFGLATPGGVVSDTGIAGLTLGGGFGWLRRKYGLSCDNVLALDVVTADGSLKKASATENPDLFWGLCGGGGNFGAVTAFEYRLHPVGPQVMTVLAFYDVQQAREALQFYREYTATAPDEVSSFAILGTIPAAEMFPQHIHGKPFVLLAAMYAGTVEEGKKILQPLRDFATPLVDLSTVMPYVQAQTIFDEDYPAGIQRYYWKSLYLDSLENEVIEHLMTHAARRPSSLSTLDIWHLGGTIERVGDQANAFSARHAPYMLGVEANWTDRARDEDNLAWARSCIASLQPFSNGREYLNFPGFLEQGEETLRKSFGGTYPRLVALKNKYDPTNLFRLNANIQPTQER